MNWPLTVLRVVKIDVAMAGSFDTIRLGDFIADVSEIECVGSDGDSRSWPPHFDSAIRHYFTAAYRNKRGIALDLK